MKIIKKAIMPDGTKIRLEDWSGCESYSELLTFGAFRKGNYTNVIIADTTAKKTDKHGWIKEGEPFSLAIVSHPYKGCTNKEIEIFFEKLKNGNKQLKDFSYHFNKSYDRFYL